MSAPARTLHDKIFSSHIVAEDEGDTLLYVDFHLLHEASSPQAFAGLKAQRRAVRRPDLALAVADHTTPTQGQAAGVAGVRDPAARAQLEAMKESAHAAGIAYFPMGHRDNGIVHVVGPEQGRTQPGMVIVCGDSHTPTHGAFGALAFGLGASDVEHVLATQTIRTRRARNMRVWVDGALAPGVHAKDLALAAVAEIGAGGAVGHVIEYAGACIDALTMEGRLTLCNMAIEAGARSALIAPDETTFAYLKGRPAAPAGAAWEAALVRWRRLRSDAGAIFDAERRIDAAHIEPFITWGVSPDQAVAISAVVPAGPDGSRARAYMGVVPGQDLEGLRIDRIFIGSCTNGRIEDLRAAAAIFAKGRVAAHVRAMIVPGSRRVMVEAEAEGLHEVFLRAGCEWREPGCSMCLGMNPDLLAPGERCVSTSNRNFEGRQGRGGRTHLASPATAAASALAGAIADPRRYL